MFRENHQINILIVDDEEKAIQVLQDFFITEGYGVFTAENGRSALERISTNPIDLVVTDFEMPVMNGFELLQAVKRGYPNLPVIILTGEHRQDMDKAIASLKEGAYDYLLKPVDLGMLRKSVVRTLYISRAKMERQRITEDLQKTFSVLNKKKEKIEELTRIHNELLKIISQDLETPLMILTGSCHMLLKEQRLNLSEKQLLSIELINRQGKTIQSMIGDLLDLAFFDTDTDEIEIREVETEMHPILEKCRRNLYPVAIQKGITINLQPPTGIKPVYMDETRMKQVFFNLLHEAIQWSNRNQTIRIGILPLAREQKVEILFRSDTFPGDSIRKILSGEAEGVDIEKRARYRLSLCREIVELHEGKIWIEDGIEGEVIFCVQVPNLFLRHNSTQRKTN